MSVEGTWNLIVSTPIGKQYATLELSIRDGSLCGVARDQTHREQAELVDLTLDGDRLSWSQSITRPMRLHLVFELVMDGDRMAGTARAGRLPSSKVSGERVPAESTKGPSTS